MKPNKKRALPKKLPDKDEGFVLPEQVYEAINYQVGLAKIKKEYKRDERVKRSPEGPYPPLPINSFYNNSRWIYRPVKEVSEHLCLIDLACNGEAEESSVYLQPGPLLCTSDTNDLMDWPTGWCGEKAEIKCLSCVKFDPQMKGQSVFITLDPASTKGNQSTYSYYFNR